MHTKRILDKIEHKLQDSSYAREELLLDLNDLLLYVTALYPLPSLQTSSTVTAVKDTDSVSLPDNYHHNLYRVENTTSGRVCKSVYNFKVLAQMHDGLTVAGSVVDVSAENGILHYRKQPTVDETLKLYYNSKPTALTDETTSTPSCLPGHLHDPILVSYILYDKFSEIEEDIQGQKINTYFYWERFLNGIQNLYSFYPNISMQNIYQRFSTGNISYFNNSLGKGNSGGDDSNIKRS